MKIAVPRESRPGERLVAATPKTVGQLVALGYDVAVQSGAGEAATFSDAVFEAAGATIVPAKEVWTADIVAAVNTPTAAQLKAMRPGATLISMMMPAAHPELVTTLSTRKVTGMALDAVPRISRAQSLDVLSTMSNVAGYRAVIEAAEEFGGMFTGQVTAAGKTAPAHVFVIGAGVAGLAAIGTAASLGAEVRAFDVRPEVGEQIESMGATFVQAEAAQQEVSSDGYAKELTDEQARLTAEMYAAESAKADVVITTALVRGTAPRTISADMVAGDEARQRDHRPRGVRRWQLRAHRPRQEDRHGQRGHDRRLHRPDQPDAAAHVAAVRHQHRQPDEAAHARQGRRARPRPGGRGAARHDRRARR